MDALRSSINNLLPRVGSGGHTARDALVRLISLTSEPGAKALMKSMGVLQVASRLMKSPSSSAEMQRLAGSVVTLLTGMPVASEISDDKTGSDSVVNVVVPRPSRVYAPDEAVLTLHAGAFPGKA